MVICTCTVWYHDKIFRTKIDYLFQFTSTCVVDPSVPRMVIVTESALRTFMQSRFV